MTRLFVSYRSSDGRKDADRLAQDLADIFGEDQIFYDKQDLMGGTSWRDEIHKTLGHKPIMLALISPDFFGARDEQGLKIERADDPVRQEVEAALRAGAVVFPLLCDGVVMPPANRLPESLRLLTERHARPLRTGDWRHDLARIAGDLERLGLKRTVKPGPGPEPDADKTRKPWGWLLFGVLVLLVLIEGGVGQEPIDRDTYVGAAVLSLVPLAMALVARQWAKRESSRWPRYGSTLMVVLAACEVLVFMGRSSNVGPQQALAPSHELPGSPPGNALGNALGNATTPPQAVLQSDPADLPSTGTGMAPVVAGNTSIAGPWVAVLDEGLTVGFVFEQQGANLRMMSAVIPPRPGVSATLRFRGEGMLQGRQVHMVTTVDNLQGPQGPQMIDQGSMSLQVSADCRAMDGTVHLASGQPEDIHFERR